ncbi:unnamed protein product [Linum tenue]|uniref:Uncharacterized protein n=1 Tax=Linum tenue TaxID=586396 RepID=A0AAV0I6J6_9ROSI|nr:unnamed protein product [Linum tenue]
MVKGTASQSSLFDYLIYGNLILHRFHPGSCFFFYSCRILKDGATPTYASKGRIVNSQIKAKVTPTSSSQLGQFLGIPEPTRSDLSKLISRFTKLNNRHPERKRYCVLKEHSLKGFFFSLMAPLIRCQLQRKK